MRAPRTAATCVMLVCAALALVLASTLSAWFLVALPFALGGAVAMWAGLSDAEALDAVSGRWDDPGGGPAGMSP